MGVLTSFENSKEKPQNCYYGVTVSSTKTDSDCAPREHEESNPSARFHLLEEVIRRNLEKRIGDKEDHESDGEIVVGHVGLGEEIMACCMVEDFGVADIGAIQITEQIDARSQRNDTAILLAHQSLLEDWIDNRGTLQLSISAILGEDFLVGVEIPIHFRIITKITPCSHVHEAEEEEESAMVSGIASLAQVGEKKVLVKEEGGAQQDRELSEAESSSHCIHSGTLSPHGSASHIANPN